MKKSLNNGCLPMMSRGYENRFLINPMYKPLYHFSTPFGWLNDPNGFSYYKGYYHLFYQHNPKATKWGKMFWGHARSQDLIFWEHLPIAINPDTKSEIFLGCFSGSALIDNNTMWLIYTGISYTKSQQLMAFSRDGIQFEKLPNPVISNANRPPFAGRMAFRDPKIFTFNSKYYVVIGAKFKAGRQIALYKSEEQWKWEYVGCLYLEKERTIGIYECPDLIIGDKFDLLLYNTIEKIKKNNIIVKNHMSTIELGKANLENCTFQSSSGKLKMDFGSDYYAPQTTFTPDGRLIAIAWMQSWNKTIPTAYLNHRWAGMMTIPREITIVDEIVHLKPAKEIYNAFEIQGFERIFLVNEEVSFESFSGSSYLLRISFDGLANLCVKVRKSDRCETLIKYEEGIICIDRSHSGHKIKARNGYDDGNVNKCDVGLLKTVKMEIFVDVSSVEIFINDRYAMSTTIYPFPNSETISFCSKKSVQIHAVIHQYQKKRFTLK
jgi:beta-fructofuranosidase